MPNSYKNKVVYNGTTLIDLTADTVTAAALMQGYTAHDASGAPIVGTSTAGTMVIRDTQDSHGGTVREITAGSVVTGTKTITANGAYDVAEYADASVNVPAPEPELQAKTATPTESQQTVTPDSGYDGLSSVTVGAVSSTYVGSGITRRSSTDLAASGATVTVPSGYYSAQASKAVSSGTAGTPTATKGSVSNHSVSVTPSVTNTTGYITGGTKTGTAVTVSASELVSGSQTITENGTVDVTNLASVDVEVESSGGASNLVQGTFTVADNPGGVQAVTIPYEGNGYPIAYSVYPAGGFYGNTEMYDLLQRYAIVQLSGVKANVSIAPTYKVQGTTYDVNGAYVSLIYKNNATNALVTGYTGGSLAAFRGDDTAYATGGQQVTFKNATTMNVFIASTSYGFAAGIEYAYAILYSE